MRKSAAPAIFDRYPKPVRARLLALRELIFDTAKATKGVGAIEEALKWGQPSYLTLKSKSGSTVRGLMDAVGVLTSIALQSGVPLKALIDKFRGSRFEPLGFTANKDIPEVSSILDYVFRYLEMRYTPPTEGG